MTHTVIQLCERCFREETDLDARRCAGCGHSLEDVGSIRERHMQEQTETHPAVDPVWKTGGGNVLTEMTHGSPRVVSGGRVAARIRRMQAALLKIEQEYGDDNEALQELVDEALEDA